MLMLKKSRCYLHFTKTESIWPCSLDLDFHPCRPNAPHSLPFCTSSAFTPSDLRQVHSLLRLIHTYHAVPMPRPCCSLPCLAAKGLDFVYTVRACLIHTCHAVPMPLPCHATTMSFWKRLLKATAQRGLGMAWHVWIIIFLPETACGSHVRIRLLPATTRSSTKVVIRSIPIR
jgi:hypothetical protein